MNFKLIKIAFVMLFLSTGLIRAFEKIDTIILDTLTEELLSGYMANLEGGELIYSYEISNVVEQLLSCPQALALVNKVLKDGAIYVRYADVSEIPLDAHWSPEERVIKLSPAQPIAQQLGLLLFKFSSALQASAQLKLHEQIGAGKIAREEYVHSWERIDYDTYREFVLSIENCIAEHDWSSDSSLRLNRLFEGGAQAPAATFEKFWDRVKNSPHADRHRKDWDQMGKDRL